MRRLQPVERAIRRLMPRPAAAARPIWVAELDLLAPPPRLSSPPPPTGSEPYSAVYLLLRVGSEPLAIETHELIDGELDVDAVRCRAHDVHGPRIAALAARSLSGSGIDAAAGVDSPPISVVIGTRRRPEKVAACVAQLLKQDYPSPFEIIVVDNDRVDDTTERVLAERFGDDDRIHYHATPLPGLSRARNIGLASARYPVTAFLSDDILVDTSWMSAVARGFARNDSVRCVLGYCPQLHLDTEPQQVFERLMGWSSVNGFEAFLASDAARTDPLYPYRIAMSNGSNMSFDTDYFRSVGGFDEALGPGTVARGGEDLDAPIRAMLAGYDLAFEPAALGWHADDQTGKDFLSLMYTYGLGLTAFLTSHLLDPSTRGPFLARVPRGARALWPVWAGASVSSPAPVGVTAPISGLEALTATRVHPFHHAANVAGRLMGPVAAVRSRRHARTRRYDRDQTRT